MTTLILACLITGLCALIVGTMTGYLIGYRFGADFVQRELSKPAPKTPHFSAGAEGARTVILTALLLGAVFGHTVPSRAGEQRAGGNAYVLAGIAEIEGWQGQLGASGEQGPWQMMPATWAAYTGSAESRAEQHLAWIRSELRRRGAADVPFNIALCWNAGLERALSGRAEPRHYDYARRVCARLEAISR